MELCRPRHNSIFLVSHASNLLNILRLNIVFVLIHGQRYNFLSQISGNSYKFLLQIMGNMASVLLQISGKR